MSELRPHHPQTQQTHPHEGPRPPTTHLDQNDHECILAHPCDGYRGVSRPQIKKYLLNLCLSRQDTSSLWGPARTMPLRLVLFSLLPSTRFLTTPGNSGRIKLATTKAKTADVLAVGESKSTLVAQKPSTRRHAHDDPADVLRTNPIPQPFAALFPGWQMPHAAADAYANVGYHSTPTTQPYYSYAGPVAQPYQPYPYPPPQPYLYLSHSGEPQSQAQPQPEPRAQSVPSPPHPRIPHQQPHQPSASNPLSDPWPPPRLLCTPHEEQPFHFCGTFSTIVKPDTNAVDRAVYLRSVALALIRGTPIVFNAHQLMVHNDAANRAVALTHSSAAWMVDPGALLTPCARCEQLIDITVGDDNSALLRGLNGQRVVVGLRHFPA
ncbi:hypothetical protein B0H13DRAFT_1853488 [Mycena leptocephala]|nr:hypothetical protein B0H13DRAFT_1853488 [Mycena leptocephala]